MTSVNINININTDITLFDGLGRIRDFFACHGIAQLHGNIVAFYCCIE